MSIINFCETKLSKLDKLSYFDRFFRVLKKFFFRSGKLANHLVITYYNHLKQY